MEMHAHEPRVLAVTGGNRNPEFVKDRERLQQMDRRGALEPAEVKAFARRWGLLLPDDKSSK
jgi:hypothetical protein